MVCRTIGSEPTTPTSPAGLDPLDALFKTHDLVYQTTQDPLARATADVQLVENMYALTFTDLGDPNYDPEAGRYEGFATLGIVAQLAAGGFLTKSPPSGPNPDSCGPLKKPL